MFAGNALAAVTLLTTRAQITETDYIDWSQLGPNLTSVPDPSVVTTTGTPFNVLVDANGSGMTRLDGVTGWATGFAAGDPLLWVMGTGPLSLTGAKTCNDFGTEIDMDPFGAFNAHMDVYDGLNNLLGSFNVAGISGSPGITPFIGVHSDAGDIHHVVLSVQDAAGVSQDFAINRVSYNCCGPVPEPASMSILALGALGLLRKKRSS